MKSILTLTIVCLFLIPTLSEANSQLRSAVERGIEIVPSSKPALEPDETLPSNVCDISDNDNAKCEVCTCYLEIAGMLSWNGIAGTEIEEQVLANEDLHQRIVQVVQARAQHPHYPTNSCEVLYQPYQFSAASHESRFRTGGLQVPRYVGMLGGFKKEMLNEKIIQACQAAQTASADRENPGDLFFVSYRHAMQRGTGRPAWLRKCTPSTDVRALDYPVTFFDCPDIERHGSGHQRRERTTIMGQEG